MKRGGGSFFTSIISIFKCNPTPRLSPEQQQKCSHKWWQVGKSPLWKCKICGVREWSSERSDISGLITEVSELRHEVKQMKKRQGKS